MNPYRGDPASALSDYALPDATRAKLRAMMATRQFTDVAVITRDNIAGRDSYVDLRGMHSGHGQFCRGPVDRSAWRARHEERGLVYCADDACVIVPTVCNNVALVTRRQDEAGDPIDIEPAGGPAPAVPEPPGLEPGGPAPPGIAPADLPPPAMLPLLPISPIDSGPEPVAPPESIPGECCCAPGGLPPLSEPPIFLPPGSGTTPIPPVPPTAPVAEPSMGLSMLAGLLVLAVRIRALVRRRPSRACPASRSSSRRSKSCGQLPVRE
jgi:hypothetical protein